MGSLRTDVEDSHQKKRGKTRLEGIQREGSQCLERIEAADRRFALVVLQAAILGVLLPVLFDEQVRFKARCQIFV